MTTVVNLIFWTILLILWRTGEVGAHGAITAILCWQVLVCVIHATLQHLGIGGITIEREEVSK